MKKRDNLCTMANVEGGTIIVPKATPNASQTVVCMRLLDKVLCLSSFFLVAAFLLRRLKSTNDEIDGGDVLE